MNLDLSLLTIIIQLIFLEGILSIDNAAVLGAMVSVLPDDKPVPYPKGLKFLQGFTDRVFGNQQSAALKVGLLGAYLGRALMLIIASFIIQNLWLRLIGALYLIKLAFSHLPAYAEGSGDEHTDTTQSVRSVVGAFWSVVLAVELADLAFSLDNVVVAVTLSEELWVMMLGVALGIVTMRFAAGIFTKMIRREPILAPAAYVLVLVIGLRLFTEDILMDQLHLYQYPVFIENNFEWIQFATSVAILGLAVLYAHSPILQRIFRPVFHLIGRVMVLVNDIFDLVLAPIGRLVRKVLGWFTPLFRWLMRPVANFGQQTPAAAATSDASIVSVDPPTTENEHSQAVDGSS